MTAKPTLIALITATHHRDLDTAAQILDGLDRAELAAVTSQAVGWLTHEIETACHCCVGFTVEEYLAAIGTAAAREGAT